MTTKGAPTSGCNVLRHFFTRFHFRRTKIERKGAEACSSPSRRNHPSCTPSPLFGVFTSSGHVELPLEEEEEEEEEKEDEEEDTRETSDEPSFATKIAAVAVGRPSNPTSVPHHQRQ